MLGARDQIGPDILRHRHIAFAHRIGVQQGGAFLPVFRARVGLDQFRIGGIAAHQPARGAGQRIGQGCGGEGKFHFREIVILMPGAGAERLREGRVEEHPPNPRHMRQHAVEHAPARLIRVEAARDVVAQIPARLGDAERQRVGDGAAGDLGAMRAKMAHDVAGGGETNALDARAGGFVADFVNRAGDGFRPLRQQRHRAGIGEGEGHGNPLRRLVAADGDMGDARGLVRQAERVMRAEPGAGDEFVADRPGQPLDRGRVQPQSGGARRGRIPARPQQREPEPQRQRVAQIGGGRGCVSGGPGAEIGQHHDAAAVVHLVQQPPIAQGGILRPEQHEAGLVGHASLGVPRRLVQQRDAAIGRMRGIERARGHALHPFIGAGSTEQGALRQGFAPGDVDAGDHGQSNSASVRACRTSFVMPGIMSSTAKPRGVTSSTARSV